jgi:hypothetical protein
MNTKKPALFREPAFLIVGDGRVRSILSRVGRHELVKLAYLGKILQAAEHLLHHLVKALPGGEGLA